MVLRSPVELPYVALGGMAGGRGSAMTSGSGFGCGGQEGRETEVVRSRLFSLLESPRVPFQPKGKSPRHDGAAKMMTCSYRKRTGDAPCWSDCVSYTSLKDT